MLTTWKIVCLNEHMNFDQSIEGYQTLKCPDHYSLIIIHTWNEPNSYILSQTYFARVHWSVGDLECIQCLHEETHYLAGLHYSRLLAL